MACSLKKYPPGNGHRPIRAEFFDGKRWRKETVMFAPHARAVRVIIKHHFPDAVDITVIQEQ